MVHARARRLTLLLLSAIWMSGHAPARAGDYLPGPVGSTTAHASAGASIIAHEAPPLLLPAAAIAASATQGIDGDGRRLSVSLPSRLTLRGATGEIAARIALAPAEAGSARLRLMPDRSLKRAPSADDYVGLLPVTLAYN